MNAWVRVCPEGNSRFFSDSLQSSLHLREHGKIAQEQNRNALQLQT